MSMSGMYDRIRQQDESAARLWLQLATVALAAGAENPKEIVTIVMDEFRGVSVSIESAEQVFDRIVELAGRH